MKPIFNRLVKKSFNNIGLEVSRASHSPARTLLGLQALPIRSIIDVGANSGQFARMISPKFPDAHIWCFEPLQEPFEQLSRWADRVGKGRISVFNVALGEDEGTRQMWHHVDHSPSSSFLQTTHAGEEIYPLTKKQVSSHVHMTTLDGIVSELSAPLPPEILIKLDVQGYEERVIKGGIKTFRLSKACIVEICLDPIYEGQPTFKGIFQSLHDLGYRYVGNLSQTLADDGHVIFLDAVFVK
jgi:FkbM family methyltransferase